MEVDVNVRGAAEAAEVRRRLARRLFDGSQQFRGIVDLLLESMAERFAGRGVRWRKLAPSTVRAEGPHRPLVLTGALMRSLTRPGAKGQVLRITGSRLMFGTRIFYAKFHQKGQGVPRRTVVGLSKQQRNGIVAEWGRLLVEG